MSFVFLRGLGAQRRLPFRGQGRAKVDQDRADARAARSDSHGCAAGPGRMMIPTGSSRRTGGSASTGALRMIGSGGIVGISSVDGAAAVRPAAARGRLISSR
jgi:hypothetical protein